MEDFFSYEEASKDEDAYFTYQELLNTKEWRTRRQQIIERDNYECQHCKKVDSLGLVPNYINVHHKYYIKGYLPWQYPDDALTTLCEECHHLVHRNERIPVYKNSRMLVADQLHLTPCYRCNGLGHIPEYRHVQGGKCFNCNGVCYEELIGATLFFNSEIVYIPKEFEIVKVFDPLIESPDTAYYFVYIDKLVDDRKVKTQIFGWGVLKAIYPGLKFPSADYKIVSKTGYDGISRYWIKAKERLYQ